MNKIEKFLELQNENSRGTMKSYLNSFFKDIKENPDKYITKDKTTQDYTNDIIKFLIRNKHKAPKTLIATIGTISIFLDQYDIELSRKQKKQIRSKIKGRRAITIDRVPKKHEIREMLEIASPRTRTLLLILISSGMRIDEVLQLKDSDIELNKNPATINIRGETTKNGLPRITFISNEAKKSLEAWRKIKDKHLKFIENNHWVQNLLKKPHDKERIFPICYETARDSFINILKNLKLDDKCKNSDRYKIHFHSFRKYFKSKMKDKMESKHLEYITAHESQLDEIYIERDEEENAKDYLENMEHITIFETPIDYAETEKKLTDQEQKIIELETKLKKITQYWKPPHVIIPDEYIPEEREYGSGYVIESADDKLIWKYLDPNDFKEKTITEEKTKKSSNYFFDERFRQHRENKEINKIIAKIRKEYPKAIKVPDEWLYTEAYKRLKKEENNKKSTSRA